MKYLRPLLIGLAILAGLLVLVIALALTSSVQTWATRRVLTAQPGMKATLGRVDVGLKRIELTALTIEQPGLSLTLPSATVEVSLLSAAQKKVSIRRLVAKGWKIDLTSPPVAPQKKVAPTAASPAVNAPAQTVKATPSSAPAPFTFDGVFKLLRLPVDLALDDVELEGEVVFPGETGKPPVRATVRFSGGKLGSGSEGRFTVSTKTVLAGAEAPVSFVEVNSVITLRMETPRTFQQIAMVTDVKAVGADFPKGASLHSELALSGGTKGETYLVALQIPTTDALKNLFSLEAAYPAGASATALTGRWKLDLSNADVAPFTLGRTLPVFVATGEGAFEADRAFSSVQASGRIDNTIEQLSVIMPELAALGRIRTLLDFDLSKHGNLVRVERFAAALSGDKPIASVQALQKFDYDIGARALKVADSSVELLRLTLHGLPLAWVQPFLKDIAIRGDDVRGEFFASARNGGFAVRPSAPVTITNLSVIQSDKPLVRALDLALKLSADSTQQGWQADVAEFSLRSGTAILFNASIKAGRPAGVDQPIKAAGRWESNLPALLAQPAAAAYAKVLNQGTARGDFTASLDVKKQFFTTLEVSNLTAPKVENLPRLQASLRLDLHPDGQIDAQIPLILDAAGRKSDLELTAHVKPGATTHIEAGVVSSAVYVQDLLPLQALAATLSAPAEKPTSTATKATGAAKPVSVETKKTANSPVADKLPFWSACTGQVKLALKEIVYSPDMKVTNIAGALKIDSGAITLDGVRAGLGSGSEAALSGKMTFNAALPEPYLFSGDAEVTGFDPAPFFRAANPKRDPTVEGKFDFASKLTGAAPNTALLASKVKADLTLISRGGVFRGLALPKAFSDRFQGKSGNLISNLSGVVGTLSGGSKNGNVAAAAVEIATLLISIPYDQLNVEVAHDANASLTTLKDFTLISPKIRLTGGGTILQQEGVPLFKQPLTAQLEMSAHGAAADLFGKQGMLQDGADSLGYLPLFAPIKIDGTLSEIGTDALVDLLVQKLLSNAAGANPLGNLFGK